MSADPSPPSLLHQDLARLRGCIVLLTVTSAVGSVDLQVDKDAKFLKHLRSRILIGIQMLKERNETIAYEFVPLTNRQREEYETVRASSPGLPGYAWFGGASRRAVPLSDHVADRRCRPPPSARSPMLP